MYQLKVDVDKLNAVASCSDEGLTLETSVQNHFHGVKLIYINLKLIHYTFTLYSTLSFILIVLQFCEMQ